MGSTDQDLARAWHLQQTGALAQAEALCLQIVLDRPRDAAAWNLLGSLAFQTGRHAVALAHFERALAHAPGVAAYHSNRGAMLQKLERAVEAEEEFRQAIRLDPTCVDAHSNLGNVLRNLRRLPEAESCCRWALALRPTHAEAHNNLGNVLRDLGRLPEAAASYRQALALKSTLPETHYNLGNVLRDLGQFSDAEMHYRRAIELRPTYATAHQNLGNLLRHLDRADESEPFFRQAVALRPDLAEAHYGLSCVLRGAGRLPEAETCVRRALELRPDFPQASNTLGMILRETMRYDEAEALYRSVLERHPDYPEGRNNLGGVLLDEGRFDDAIDCFQRTIEVSPSFALAHQSLSMLWLLHGDFERGWTEYEWRWRAADAQLPTYTQPLWDGSPLAGRTILLHPEQGHGDTFHFIRYAALLKERGGIVHFHCPRPLLTLLASCPGVDRLIPTDTQPPAYDVQAPLLSLPRLLGTRLDNIPAPVPYLKADPALVERWRTELAAVAGLKVGIVWQGNPEHKGDQLRSVPYSRFAPLQKISGVRLVNLQVDAQISGDFDIVDLASRFDTSSYSDAAAALMCLDLLITIDTSLAHLAGALGVPVWVALRYAPDWRWLLHRDDSPWYPTMRLVRQTRPGDWDGVFERIGAALESLR